MKTGGSSLPATLSAMLVLLGACGAPDAPSSPDDDARTQARLIASAKLAPDGPQLDRFVEWALYDAPAGGETKGTVLTGEIFDTPRLDIEIPPGDYILEAELDDVDVRRDITLSPGEATELDIPIETALLVIDPVNQTEGVSGRLTLPDGNTRFFGMGAPGAMSLDPGDYELNLERGAATVSQPVSLSPGEMATLSPDLSTGTLSASFGAGETQPDFGLEWTIRSWDAERGRRGDSLARELGTDFEIDLPPGTYYVAARASGMLRSGETVEVTAGETTEHVVDLAWARLKPRLMGTDGTEVSDGFNWWLLDAAAIDDKPWEVFKPGETLLMGLDGERDFLLAAHDPETGDFIAMSDPLEPEAGETLDITLSER